MVRVVLFLEFVGGGVVKRQEGRKDREVYAKIAKEGGGKADSFGMTMQEGNAKA
jgi:hypothetical protein